MKAMKVLAIAAMLVVMAVPIASAQPTWDSSFTVVNMGTADATVSITFYTADSAGGTAVPGITDLGSGRTNPFTLAAGAKAIIYVPGVPALPDGRYSVVISANQPVAAIANLAGVDSTINYNGSYSGENTGGNTMYMPNVNKGFYGWTSELSIQNVSGSAQDITLQIYRMGALIYTSPPENVEAYASWHVPFGSLATSPSTFTGAAVVTGASGPVAVVDNQTNNGSSTPSEEGKNQEYNGFTAGSTVLYCPALYRRFMEGTQNWQSSAIVQNIGTTTTTVSVQYSDCAAPVTWDLAAKSAKVFFQDTETCHTKRSLGATITSLPFGAGTAQPIVAIVNAATFAAAIPSQAQTYSCVSEGFYKYYGPIVEVNAFRGSYPQGWNSALQILNLEADVANVSITYVGQITVTQNVTISANASKILYTPAVVGISSPFNGSFALTSDNLVVTIVNQSWEYRQSLNEGDFSMSYNAFGQ